MDRTPEHAVLRMSLAAPATTAPPRAPSPPSLAQRLADREAQRRELHRAAAERLQRTAS